MIEGGHRPRTRRGEDFASGGKWFRRLPIPGAGMARTRTVRRPSANGRVSLIAGKQNHWAIEATQGSRGTRPHPGTKRASRHSGTDNRAPLEHWTQAFLGASAFPYFVPTAFTWIAL